MDDFKWKLTKPWWCLWRLFYQGASVACVLAMLASPAGANDNSALSLRSKYRELEAKLSSNSFQRPIYLDSTESSNQLTGDVYASVEYPYLRVSKSLSELAAWCEILILHINTKYCRPSTDVAAKILSIRIGRKYFQALDRAHPLLFEFSPIAATPEYFAVELSAKTGPAGTSNYLIFLEVTPLRNEKSFVHLSYKYTQNFIARLAMQTYLATIGRHKVGFTKSDDHSTGHSDFIGGVRGVVERNTMRYYLAVNAYLDALSAPPDEQLERRLHSWFEATERYPRQLHEMNADIYMKMKMSEYSRMKQLGMVDFDNPYASRSD